MSLRRSGWRLPACGALIALALFVAPGAGAAERVDIELVLAVDVSLSMSPGELEIQRHGYAAALTHDTVLQAIADGAYGRVAITYVEWAGTTMQRVVVPWAVIANRNDADLFVAQMSARPPNSARRTSISAVLEFAGDLFAESGFESMKRVIDVSGDGPNNQGGPVDVIRDRLAAQGITINGLPLMTTGGFISAFDVPHLDRYYADCVIGGPGAFTVPVNDWTQFSEAVRRKLVMELAGVGSPIRAAEEAMHPPVVLAAGEPATDCLTGEKMWRNRNWMYDGDR